MVADDFFGHGSDFVVRITAVGYKWFAAGENIATASARESQRLIVAPPAC